MACTPNTFAYRISLLVFIGLLTLGSYFCYDQPGALPGPFTLYLAQNSTEQFSLMYSIYSFPNIVLPFLGGWLIDYVLGERLGMSMCVTLVFAGNLMVVLAATWSTADTDFLRHLTGRYIGGGLHSFIRSDCSGPQYLGLSRHSVCPRHVTIWKI